MSNSPPRGLGLKALEEISDEAAFRGVSLLRALETANLPPKAKAAAHAFADAVRSVAQDRNATLADQFSLLLDRTGYRAWLRESKAEETTDRLENLQERSAWPVASTAPPSCSSTPPWPARHRARTRWAGCS